MTNNNNSRNNSFYTVCKHTNYHYNCSGLINNTNVLLLFFYRFYSGMQSRSLSGGQDEFREGCQHPEVLHNLRITRRLRTLCCQYEQGHYHVVKQKAASVHPGPFEPWAHWGEDSSSVKHWGFKMCFRYLNWVGFGCLKFMSPFKHVSRF